MKRTLVVIGVLAAAALVGAIVWQWRRGRVAAVPNDDEVSAQFRAHRADFDAIRDALAGETAPLVIAPARQAPPERFAKVVSAMHAIGCDLVTRGGDGSIRVTVYDAGELTSGATIDVVWRATPPETADPAHHSSHALDDDWYVERYVH